MQFAGNPSIVAPGWVKRSTHAAVRVSYAILLLYHTVLLTFHVWEGRLLQPEVSLRWLVGGLLFAGFLRLRRLNLSLYWGRKAMVLWLLVGLLHCHALAVPAVGEEAAGLPTTVVALLSQTTSLAAFAFGLWLLALRLRSRQHLVAPLRMAVVANSGRALSPSPYLYVISPRPPPIA